MIRQIGLILCKNEQSTHKAHARLWRNAQTGVQSNDLGVDVLVHDQGLDQLRELLWLADSSRMQAAVAQVVDDVLWQVRDQRRLEEARLNGVHTNLCGAAMQMQCKAMGAWVETKKIKKLVENRSIVLVFGLNQLVSWRSIEKKKKKRQSSPQSLC